MKCTLYNLIDYVIKILQRLFLGYKSELVRASDWINDADIERLHNYLSKEKCDI